MGTKICSQGCRVIDNSSAFRMDEDKKLIIPEINGDLLTEEDFIIANPNCSTIQMLIALAPLHQLYTIKRVVVSTYQSISRSEEHTSELQSRPHLVCRLLLEK